MSSPSQSQEHQSVLRVPNRYITTNDPNGTSIFSSQFTDTAPVKNLPGGCNIYFCYGSTRMPANFDSDNDMKTYQSLIDNPPPGVVIPGGIAARVIDLPPGYTSPMHRTISLSYNWVIEGQAELIMDSGDIRRLKPGDMAVQRAVNHAWRNASETNWARITAVAIPAEQPAAFRDGETNTNFMTEIGYTK